MTFLSDEVLDQGLDYATTNGTRVYLCSQEPATYAEASSTYALGNITGHQRQPTTDGDVSGRKVTIRHIQQAALSRRRGQPRTMPCATLPRSLWLLRRWVSIARPSRQATTFRTGQAATRHRRLRTQPKNV